MIVVPSPAQFWSELNAHYSYRDDCAAGSVRLQNYLSFVLALRHLLFCEALHDMIMDEPYYEFANHLQSVMLPIMRQHYIWDRFMRRYQINDRPAASRVTRFHCTADRPFTSYMLYRLETDREYQPPPPCLTAADAVRYLMHISTVDLATHPGDSDTDKEDHYSWIIQRLFNDVDYAFNREQQSQAFHVLYIIFWIMYKNRSPLYMETVCYMLDPVHLFGFSLPLAGWTKDQKLIYHTAELNLEFLSIQFNQSPPHFHIAMEDYIRNDQFHHPRVTTPPWAPPAENAGPPGSPQAQ